MALRLYEETPTKHTLRLEEISGGSVKDQLEYLFNNYTYAVVEIGDITITDPIEITNNNDIRQIKLINGTITLESNMFKANKYLPQFANVNFTSNGKYILESGYIGIAFDNCNFYKTGLCNYISSSTISFIQSFYINGCVFHGMSLDFCTAKQCYDLKVTNSRFESSSNTMFHIEGTTDFNVNQASITNNLFEGFASNSPIIFGSTFELMYSGNYNEANITSLKFATDNINASICGNIFNTSDSSVLHIDGVYGNDESILMMDNIWNGADYLTDVLTSWRTNVKNKNYVSKSQSISKGSFSTQWLPRKSYTFDSSTNTLTITFRVPGQWYDNTQKFNLFISGQYSSGSVWYTGYIDANIYTYGYYNGSAVVTGVKSNVVDAVVNNSGAGTPSLTVTASTTAPATANATITVTCTNFVKVQEVQLVSSRALGSFCVYDTVN